MYVNHLWVGIKTQGCRFLHHKIRAGLERPGDLMHFLLWRTIGHSK